MINSRKIEDLVPELQVKCKQFIENCKAQGIDVLITQTYRDNEYQDSLYALGRTKPGKIVTNAKGGQSKHNIRRAFDFVPLKDGKPDWNSDKWAKCGEIGKALGLTWGGSFTKIKDMPHFEI